MKETDLMIGDWVRVKRTQKIVKVKELKQSCIYTEDNGYEYSEIEPIPLTPEILEKNGFSEDYRNDDLSYAQSCGDVIGIHIFGKNGLMDEMYFKYIQELQHALRLCRIEKEIEL